MFYNEDLRRNGFGYGEGIDININNSNTNIEIPSLNMLINTTPVIAIVREYFISLDINIIVRNNLISCSIILEIIVGSICSFPKK